jgi:general secretion pathway protein G
MSGDTWRRSRRGRREGFTLIEVMIVIAIVLALMALVGVSLLSRKKDADKDLARYDILAIGQGMKMFYLDYSRYPTDEEGIKVLWDKSGLSSDADQTKWRKCMEKPIPVDRWGTPWNYKQAGEHEDGMYDLWSNGPDKESGNDDDITSWGAAGANGASGASGSSEEAPPPAPKSMPPASGG